MLAQMINAAIEVNPYTEMWALALDDLPAGKRGEHDNDDIGVDLAESSEGANTVEDGHVDIHEHEVGAFLLITRDGLLAVRRFHNGDGAELFEQKPDKFPNMDLVVDEKDFSIKRHDQGGV